MKRLIYLIGALALCTTLTCFCVEKDPKKPIIIQPGGGEEEGGDTPNFKLGAVLPAWVKGQFDIHFVNTTAGECIFLIFPDGTQMLIDAAGSSVATGDVKSVTNTGIRSRWDPTTGVSRFNYGEFISRYIRKCQAWTGNDKLDYILLTHFHNDHFGGADGHPVSGKSSSYTQQSLPLILDNFEVGKLMDRGWPDYDYPFDMCTLADNAANCRNYVTAVKWHNANNGLKVERFVAGSKSQITLQQDAASYPTFTVRNLSVNGNIWTGNGEESKATFPELKDIKVADPKNIGSADNCPAENHNSCAAKFSYGAFDFFAGGDLQYNGFSTYSWKDIETPVAKVCGEVDVMKADHHGTIATNGYGERGLAWATKYLKPKCWVVNSWTDQHPRQATYEGVTGYLSDMDVFITNTCSDMQKYNDFNRVKGSNGHIVVRVYDGGAKYYVVTVSDSDEKMTVKQIAGPYKSK